MTDWHESETGLVAEFVRRLDRDMPGKWTVYPETAGWDLLLVNKATDEQIGIEAKLSLNAKVIDQALSGTGRAHYWDGPDYRAVLVPATKVQLHLGRICSQIGIVVIPLQAEDGCRRYLNLPCGDSWQDPPNWCPAKRCPLPDYVPDVPGGAAAPVQLTPWKVKAIKLMIVLERRGWVDRDHMRAVQISPTRWTDRYQGFLSPAGSGQYVRSERTPDLKAQHPRNWLEIEADRATWGVCFDPFKQACPDWLL